ncbi:hypothetical protein ACTS9K_08380 [Empedobacter sp. ULE_I145]
MDRFLLCENPMKDENRPIYILQTIEHRMLIEVIPYNNLEDIGFRSNDIFDLFTYYNPAGFKEDYMLKVVVFYDLDITEIDEVMAEIRLHITKAWKWYKSYIIWQDNEIDFEDNTDNFYMN